MDIYKKIHLEQLFQPLVNSPKKIKKIMYDFLNIMYNFAARFIVFRLLLPNST